MSKQYVVSIILQGKDENLKKTLREGGVAVDDFADKAETGGQRIQHALTGAAIAMTFGKSIPFMREALGLYAEAQSATTSLGSAVKYAGEDFDAAQEFLESYVSDGLIPLAQASVSLKNLLLAGYGLERSIEIMRALKDFAAFGRQGQLSMGEAVQRATEGLKNQMSQLVDNAGLTKNLSVMYREYARSIGKGAGSLTEAEKVTAVYLGVMGEWPAVHGDAEKASDQLTGAMARQDARLREMKETIGGALEPVYEKLLGILGPVVEGVKSFAAGNEEATATLLSGAGLVAGVAALAAAFAIMGPIGAMVVGVAAGVVALGAAIVSLRKHMRPSTQALIEGAEALDDHIGYVKDLRDKYEDLSGKPDKSAEEHGRLQTVMAELADVVPRAVDAFDEEGRILNLNLSALDEYIEAQEIIRGHKRDELSKRLAQALKDQKQAEDELSAAVQKHKDVVANAKDETEAYGDRVTGAMGAVSSWVDKQDLAYKRVEETTAAVASYRELVNQLRLALDRLDKTTKDVNEDLEETGEDTEETGKKAVMAAFGLDELAYQYLFVGSAAEEFLDKTSGLPITLEEWLDMFRALKEELLGTGEAAEETGEDINSFEAKLRRATAGWGTWADVGVAGIVGVTDTFGDMLALFASGSSDISEQLSEIWNSFFDMMINRIMDVIAQLIVMNALQALFPGAGWISALFGESGGTVAKAAKGGTIARAQHGGVFRGLTGGLDRIPVLAQINETFLSTDLTRRLDRMVGDYESGRAGATVLEPAPGYASAPAAAPVRDLHFYAIDGKSLREAIRHGPLGRELMDALLYGRIRG